MEPIPLIVPQAFRRLLAFGEQIGEPVSLPATLRAGETPVPLAFVGDLLDQLALASGYSFARLVDEARFEAASHLLRDPAVRITDISVELGYTDAANFTRAFRRWAGISPTAFRRATCFEPGAAAR